MDLILSAQALRRGGQHFLISLHDVSLPFACAHLISCATVLIVRNGAFVVAARVVVRPLCRACGEHSCARYNRDRPCKTNSHHWSPGPCNLQTHHQASSAACAGTAEGAKKKPVSALDHKQTFRLLFGMSGLPLKADFLIARSRHHQAGNSEMAAKGPIADMPRTMGTHKCRSFDEWARARPPERAGRGTGRVNWRPARRPAWYREGCATPTGCGLRCSRGLSAVHRQA